MLEEGRLEAITSHVNHTLIKSSSPEAKKLYQHFLQTNNITHTLKPSIAQPPSFALSTTSTLTTSKTHPITTHKEKKKRKRSHYYKKGKQPKLDEHLAPPQHYPKQTPDIPTTSSSSPPSSTHVTSPSFLSRGPLPRHPT